VQPLNVGGGLATDLSRVPVGLAAQATVQPYKEVGPDSPRRRETPARGGASVAPLPNHLRSGLEALSGESLSDVRVYRDSPRPSQLDALAYTQGRDIYVAPGQEQHLAHEGWHAVQQRHGRVHPTTRHNGTPINDDPRLEHEADVMGAKAQRIGGAAAGSHGHQTQAEPAPKTVLRRQDVRQRVGNMTLHGTSVSGAWYSGAVQRLAEEDMSTDEAQNQVSGDNEAVLREYASLVSAEGTGDMENSASAAPASSGGSTAQAVSQFTSLEPAQLNGCSPANTAVGAGALAWVRRTRESWRSHVSYRADVDNPADHLTVDMHVFAKAYYGLWFNWETLDFSATVDLTCQTVNNRCEIGVNERGGSVFSLLDSPASGAIAIHTNSRAAGTQNALTVRVGAGVGANSAVSAGVGPASVGVSFPDASISHKMSMGTFIYTCRET
jgi:hypothetical protein